MARALTTLRVVVEASLALVAAPASRVLGTVALACLFVADVGVVDCAGGDTLAVLAAELGMEAEEVVQTHLALFFFNVHGTVAFARDLVAAACDAVAFLALGEAIIAGLAAGALTSNDVRFAFAVTSEYGALF